MKHLRLISFVIATLLCLPVPAFAQLSSAVYVSPTGTDTGTCPSSAPCATMQYAATQAAWSAVLYLADGTYNQTLVLVGQRINVMGNSANPGNVIVNGATGQTVFDAEDLSVLTLNGMLINAPGGIGVHTRQFSVIDYQDIYWGPAIIHVSAQEHSKINGNGGELIIASAGTYGYHAAAGDHSTVELNGTITLQSGTIDSFFLLATDQSTIDCSSANFSGEVSGGYQWNLDQSRVKLPTSGGPIPGFTAGNNALNYSVEN